MKNLYLCGPIAGRTTEEACNWRDYIKSKWNYGTCWDPMRRDYRGVEMTPEVSAEIVAGDLVDIQNSDAVVVFYDKPSVGTSMEIFYAHHVLGRYVILIDAQDSTLSPWLVHHTNKVVKTIDEALDLLETFNRY